MSDTPDRDGMSVRQGISNIHSECNYRYVRLDVNRDTGVWFVAMKQTVLWSSQRVLSLTVRRNIEKLRQIREAAVLLQVSVNEPARVLQRLGKCSGRTAGSNTGRHGYATTAICREKR